MQPNICVLAQMCICFHTPSETNKSYKIKIYQQSVKAKNRQWAKYTFLPACYIGYEMIIEYNNQQKEYQQPAKKQNVCESFDDQSK